MGATATALMPLVDLLRREVIGNAAVLHGDDTPVPILVPGTGKTRTGRLWTYVRDERSHAGVRPPAAVFFVSPDRKGAHPLAHLTSFEGVLQADGYAGFNGLYERGRIVEAACWAEPVRGSARQSRVELQEEGHVRRKFFDVHVATGSAVAREALERIGALYDIERGIRGQPPDARRHRRQERSRPLMQALRTWADATAAQLPGRSDLAGAFRYMLTRWDALTRVLCTGRMALDNNSAKRALRGVAVGRKNYLFAGSERGAEHAASLYSLIETAKLNGLDPEAYLHDVLARIADHPGTRLADLLP